MIKTAKNSATRQFIETGKNKFKGMDANKAALRVLALDSASSPDGLSKVGALRLHKLTGSRAYWSIAINGPWRLVFKFEDGHALDVEIVDYQ